MNDYELAEGLKSGDEAAWQLLIKRYGGAMCGVFLAIMPNRTLALDTYQDFLGDLFAEKIHKYYPKGRLKTWLCRSALNYGLNELRRPYLRMAEFIEQFLPPEATSEMAEQEKVLYRQELRVILSFLMRNFGRNPSVSVFWSHHMDGLSLEEIARMHGCSLEAAKKRHQRSRALLKSMVNNRFSFLRKELGVRV